MTPDPPPDPQAIRETVDEVLSQAEFQPDPLERWQGILADWLKATVSDFIAWSEAHPIGRIVVIAAFLSVAALLIVGAVLYLKRLSARRGQGPGPAGSASWQALEGRAQDWDSALALARMSLVSGDLYQAVWIGHRLLLSLLDHRGLLDFAKWKTNSAYLRECRPGPARALLSDLSDVHDQVVYAHRDASSRRIEQLLIQVDELQRNPGLPG